MTICGYWLDCRQICKTTTYKPQDAVTHGKSEKPAQSFAHAFEKNFQGSTTLNENMRFTELSSWYFEQIAPTKLKEATLYSTKKAIDF